MPAHDEVPLDVTIDRTVLLALLERVEWFEALHGASEEIYRSMPGDVRECIDAARNRETFEADLAVTLAMSNVERREELHGQLKHWGTLIRLSLTGKVGKLVGNVTASTMAGVLRYIQVQGTKAVRETERFTEAFDCGDTAFLITKCANGHAESVFSHHLPPDFADTLGLRRIY